MLLCGVVTLRTNKKDPWRQPCSFHLLMRNRNAQPFFVDLVFKFLMALLHRLPWVRPWV